jgi:hypothetical protein
VPRLVEPETVARILSMHAEGMGRNQIAKELGLAWSTVTKHVREAGLSFDTSQTELAVRARTLDLAVARAELGKMMLAAATDLLEQIDAPAVMTHYQPAGEHTEGEWVEHVIDQPTFSDQQRIMTMAAIAFDKGTKALEKNSAGVEGAVGLLDIFGDSLKAAADALRPEPVEDQPDYGSPDAGA